MYSVDTDELFTKLGNYGYVYKQVEFTRWQHYSNWRKHLIPGNIALAYEIYCFYKIMGGKSYFCDYCKCFMKNDRNVRKTHNEGLQHKIIKTSYMKIFEDPRKLYEEEINKQPCSRYFRNFCKYDLYCQYTHFNQVQLRQLKEIATNVNSKSILRQSKKKNSKLPWENSITKINTRLLPRKLPPSLKPLNLNKLSKLDNVYKWG